MPTWVPRMSPANVLASIQLPLRLLLEQAVRHQTQFLKSLNQFKLLELVALRPLEAWADMHEIEVKVSI